MLQKERNGQSSFGIRNRNLRTESSDGYKINMVATRAGGGDAAAAGLGACLNAGTVDTGTVIVGLPTSNPHNLIGDAFSFYNAMLLFGLTYKTVEELFRHGLLSLKSLVQFMVLNLERLAKNITSNKSPNAMNNVWFHTLPCANIKYLWLWSLLRNMCGLQLLCTDWDVGTDLDKIMFREEELETYDSSDKLDDLPKLKSMKEFHHFHKALLSYLQTKRGPNKIPLVYIV